MTTLQYESIIRAIGIMEAKVNKLADIVELLVSTDNDLVTEVKKHIDIEGKLKALAVEVQMLKDEKEI